MSIEALVASSPLRMGAIGDGVKQIQLALKARGYPLTGTGYFGPQTDTSVEDFQRTNGLPVTGVVDAGTARALDKAPAPLKSPQTPLWLAVSLAHLGLHEGVGATDNKELIADIQTVAPDYQHVIAPSVSMPAARQNRSKDADTSSHALPTLTGR